MSDTKKNDQLESGFDNFNKHLQEIKIGSEAKDEDDPLPFKLGLHPSDETDSVSVNGSSSIYESIKKFEDLKLSKELLDGVYAMKFVRPSKIQADGLPLILGAERQNLIAQAHHGSGKTATYALGILARIDTSKKVVQGICLCPSRELARQVCEVIQSLGKYTSATVCLVIPTPDAESARGQVTDPIVVGTPGTVKAKIYRGEINPRNVSIFVCDEADVMVMTGSEGMGDQTLAILDKLPRPQVLLFSATFPERVRKFAMRMAPNAAKIIVKREELTLEGIKQYFMEFKSSQEKFDALMNIYGLLNIGQSIVFVHTRHMAKDLCKKNERKRLQCVPITWC